MLLKAHSPAPRRGLSLVELLIVAAIIMILIALTAGATIRYADVQHKRNTELTLAKLDSAIRANWSAITAKASNDKIPDAVSKMAGGNDQLARVLFVKFSLLREFPMNFEEATGGGAPVPARDSYVM